MPKKNGKKPNSSRTKHDISPSRATESQQSYTNIQETQQGRGKGEREKKRKPEHPLHYPHPSKKQRLTPSQSTNEQLQARINSLQHQLGETQNQLTQEKVFNQRLQRLGQAAEENLGYKDSIIRTQSIQLQTQANKISQLFAQLKQYKIELRRLRATNISLNEQLSSIRQQYQTNYSAFPSFWQFSTYSFDQSSRFEPLPFYHTNPTPQQIIPIPQPSFQPQAAILQNELVAACRLGNLEYFQKCIDAGAKPQITNDQGVWPLAAAIWGLNRSVIQYIENKFGNPLANKMWLTLFNEKLLENSYLYQPPALSEKPLENVPETLAALEEWYTKTANTPAESIYNELHGENAHRIFHSRLTNFDLKREKEIVLAFLEFCKTKMATVLNYIEHKRALLCAPTGSNLTPQTPEADGNKPGDRTLSPKIKDPSSETTIPSLSLGSNTAL